MIAAPMLVRAWVLKCVLSHTHTRMRAYGHLDVQDAMCTRHVDDGVRVCVRVRVARIVAGVSCLKRANRRPWVIISGVTS